MNPCNPDILTSYVDGALSVEQSRHVEAHLNACPPCAETVRAHRELKRRLAASAALMIPPAGLSARVGRALDQLPPPHPGTFSRGGRGGFGGTGGLSRFGWPLAVATVVTSAGLWFAHPIWQPEPVNVRAIMWHHRDAIHPPKGASFATADDTTARRWVAARLSEASTAPRLSARLRGIGVCRVDDAPAAIWMYDAGRPVSLIEIYKSQPLPDWSPAPAAGNAGSACYGWRSGTYGGYNALIWQSEGRTYALVSDLPTERLAKLLEPSP
jgi:anti-sigma factor RsiW